MSFEAKLENEQWSSVPTAVKELLKKMLTRDHMKRPSAEECL